MFNLKKRVILFLFIYMSGCSVELSKMKVEDERLMLLPQRKLDEMEIEVKKLEGDPNKVNIRSLDNSRIELDGRCRLNYEEFYFDLIRVVSVKGGIESGREYTVFLDTGYSGYMLTNSLTVLENRLAVCPLGSSDIYPYFGFCVVDKFKIGEAVISEPPCLYLQQQWELKLLGLTVWQQRGFLCGLGLLSKFNYMVFDNVIKKVEFSLEESFEPGEGTNWEEYKMFIEDERLVVEMPVNGIDTEMMFDTCGRYGMVVKDSGVQEYDFLADIESEDIRESSFLGGFHGVMNCERVRLETLRVGDIDVKNAEVLILPSDSLYTECGIIISMEFFKDCSVVLDFENGLMWVGREWS